MRPRSRTYALVARLGRLHAIVERVKPLCGRLEARAGQLDARLQAQRNAAPKRPGLLGLGAASYMDWQRHVGRTEARRAQLLACASRVREYLSPAIGLHQSKCRELAVRRLNRQAPALMSEVLEHRRDQSCQQGHPPSTRARGR